MTTNFSNNEPYKSFSGFGVDVAVKRTDDLDKKMLAHIRNKSQSKVLDLGCGAGGQSFRLVEAGAKVLAIDVYDFSEEFNEYKNSKGISNEVLEFVCANISELEKVIRAGGFTDVSIQRTIHYLPYDQAVKLLTFLKTVVSDKLFISATGLTSAVGENYLGKNKSIESRFEKLESAEADIFQIHAPVCLYDEVEFMSLLTKANWEVEEIWQSAFGNIKAVCKNN